MNTQDLYEEREHFFLKISPTARGGIITCGLIGIVTLLIGLADPERYSRVWGAYLFNLFFFFAIGLGGAAFCGMQDVIGAVWGRPIRRIHEAFAAFVPVAAILFLIFLTCVAINAAGAADLFEWLRNPDVIAPFEAKTIWLQKNFMITRDAIALVILCGFVYWQICPAICRDQSFVKGNRDEAKAKGIANRDRLRYWSAPVLFIYALCFSLLGFDLLMSLAPLWFSTLWGGWLFAIMMQTLMATLIISMFVLKKTPIGRVIQRQQFHDVGKLMHGFTIFFAYLTYAHVLTYWYGNMPEETEYFIHRLHQPWLSIVLIAPLFSFVVPLFTLIFKPAKWTAVITIPIASVILIAQWATLMLVVMPAATHDFNNGPWIEIGLFFGFLGLFLSTILWFGKRYPMVPLADPLLEAALDGGHH